MQSHHKQNQQGHRELISGRNLILKYLDEFKCCLQLRNTFCKYISEDGDENHKDGLEIFTSSFSQKRSCGYAKKKYGQHCIEFKKSFINKLDSKYREVFANVIYDPNKQALLIKEMFCMYKSSREKNREQVLALWLSIIIPFFKEPRDHPDNESRIVTANIFQDGKLESLQAVTEIPFESEDIINHG